MSQEKPHVPVSKFREAITPFAVASIASCTATTVIQPMDTLKVRLQIASESRGMSGAAKESVATTAGRMLKAEGVGAFYNGLSAALLRQFTYGTIRIGVYRYLSEQEMKVNKTVSLGKKFSYSMFSGAIGSLFGNPFDVTLVRFQSDSTLPVDQRRNYKSIADAFRRMYAEEGLMVFWKGYLISLMRACAMTSVMLTVNDEVKSRINVIRGVKKSDNVTNLSAAALSGIACSFASLPFDNIKTKLQKMKKLPDGSVPYDGVFDCFRKTFRREGLSGFWSGYTTFYFRVAPHAMILLLLEDLLLKKFNPNYNH